jgi:hypothetical protein
VFFDKFCSVSTKSLCSTLACSKSRLNSILKSEHWNIFQDQVKRKILLQIIPIKDSSKWVLREYPKDFLSFLSSHPQIISRINTILQPKFSFEKLFLVGQDLMILNNTFDHFLCNDYLITKVSWQCYISFTKYLLIEIKSYTPWNWKYLFYEFLEKTDVLLHVGK